MEHSYRNRTEILAKLLDKARTDISKTKLMYEAYLNHAQLKTYLKYLIEKGLVIENTKTEQFHTTAKGLKYLEHSESMKTLIGGE